MLCILQSANFNPDVLYAPFPNSIAVIDFNLIEFDCLTGALFVLVLDLSQYSMSDYDYRVMVGDWINLVISHIPNAVIIIVPTHIDVCQDKGEDVDQKCEDVLKRIHAEEERRVEFLGKEKEILKADSEDTRSKETLESLQRTRPFFSSCFYSKVVLHSSVVSNQELICKLHLKIYAVQLWFRILQSY